MIGRKITSNNTSVKINKAPVGVNILDLLNNHKINANSKNDECNDE
jgi:hypothetical protein